jgi:hypothetical protein
MLNVNRIHNAAFLWVFLLEAPIHSYILDIKIAFPLYMFAIEIPQDE